MSNKVEKNIMEQDARRELKPKLRFPEFRDEPEWKAEKLGAVASLITERAGNKKCVPMSITSGVGLVSQQEKFGRTIAGNQYENYLVLQKNDFAYNKSATKEFPQGFIAKYSGDEPAAVPNSIFTCFRVHEDGIVPDFLNYLFVGNLHGKWLKKYIEVSARAHGSLSIGDEDLLSLPIPLPSGGSSRAEQQKIAACLTSVDELIADHGQKLDALKAHKKGLMRQLFPREGETFPRLRFPGFMDDWEENTLDGLSDSISSGKDKTDSSGAYDLYGSTGIIGKTSSDSYEGEYILVARVGANAGMLTRAFGQFGVTDNTLVISLNPASNLTFVFYYLDNLNLNRLIYGSGQPLITGGQLKILPILLPIESERTQIATCLSSLDELIAGQSQKLDALKTYKQGLMQQLFPSTKEES